MDNPETNSDPTKAEAAPPTPEAATKRSFVREWADKLFGKKPVTDAGLTGNPADARQDLSVPPAVPDGLQPPLGIDPKEIGTRAGVDTAGVAPTTPGLTPDVPAATEAQTITSTDAPSVPTPVAVPAVSPAEAAPASDPLPLPATQAPAETPATPLGAAPAEAPATPAQEEKPVVLTNS